MGTFSRIRDILFHPDSSFKEIQKETGIRNGLRFLTFLILFVLLFLTYTYLDQINSYLELMGVFGSQSITIPITIKTYTIAYVSLAVFFIGLSFIRYWIIHWFVLLFKGAHPYGESYKALVYSRAPEYISAPLMLGAVMLFPFIGNIYALSALILLGIPLLAVSIYQMVLRTRALSHMQHISYLKSFLSIYVLGLITQLLIVGAIEVVTIGAVLYVFL